jgi:hypothetical protein
LQSLVSDSTLVKRFWKHVKVGPGCWPWTGCTSDEGYGRLQKDKNSGVIYAHRFSFEMHKGKIPPGILIMHECDNPPCCNPKHLHLGTVQMNNDDAAKKGRKLSGKNHPHYKHGRFAKHQ